MDQETLHNNQADEGDSGSGKRPSRWRPILVLMLLAVVLPELLTGSTSLPAFLNPVVILFLILGYGLPVLLIRELAVRYQVGLRGLVLCGVAYGIFNEGVLAKTLLLPANSPIPQFDGYGYAMGIGWPWLAFICLWHSCASVVFPISLTYDFFPAASRQNWIRPTVTRLLAVLLIAIGGLIFFSDTRGDGVVGHPVQMVVFGCLMICLIAMAIVFKGRWYERTGTPSWLAAGLGASVVVPFILLCAMAEAKVNLLFFFGGFSGVIALYWWILRRNGWLSPPGFLSFAIGWYLQTAVVSVVIRLGNPLLAATSALVEAVILIALWRLIQRT